jgi:hypothetical protein
MHSVSFYYVAHLLSVGHLLSMFTTFHDFCLAHQTGILVVSILVERWLTSSSSCHFIKEWQICTFIVINVESSLLHSLCCPFFLHISPPIIPIDTQPYQPSSEIQFFVRSIWLEFHVPTTSRKWRFLNGQPQHHSITKYPDGSWLR